MQLNEPKLRFIIPIIEISCYYCVIVLKWVLSVLIDSIAVFVVIIKPVQIYEWATERVCVAKV